MTTELQFAVIKDELTAMVDDIIRQFLNDKDYDQKEAQSWCNAISDEIIKALHQQQRGFKFFCTCLSSKKDTAQWTSAQPAYGAPTMMVLSLLNMKMTNYTALSAYSVVPHKLGNFQLGLFKS